MNSATILLKYGGKNAGERFERLELQQYCDHVICIIA